MIEKYLARIGMSSAPACDIDGLDSLQRAHTRSIAFENLDIRLGRGIRIDGESVFEKLVRRRRGGYCFEQNRLFSDVLTTLGVANRPLLARGRLNLPPESIPPRTHVCLLATVGGEEWLLDAGFGGLYIAPMRLEDGVVTCSGHRLRQAGEAGSPEGQWWLERAAQPVVGGGEAADWQPQYSFDTFEVAPEDLEQASHWTSTRPDTRFTTGHIASISLPDGFASLNDRQLTVYRADGKDIRQLDDPAAYADVLRNVFKLAVSDGEAAALPLFAPG